MLSNMITNPAPSVIGFITGVPGIGELLILGFIVLLLFGKRLPELMGSLGRSVVEFKKGARELENSEPRDSEPKANMEP